MITIKQIAENLNMSPTTVSNVIHGKTKEVSRETIERVRQYLDEVHYVPNMTARNLAQNQSNIIGIVLKTSEKRYAHILCDPFVAEMLGGIERAVRDAGFYMMLYISEDISEIINHIATWNVDGLLLFWLQDDDAIKVYQRFLGPVVFIDTYVNWSIIDGIGQNYVNVGLTDEQSAYEAVSYLVEKGHKSIGIVTENRSGVNLKRLEGYRRALRDAGLPFHKEHYFVLDTTVSGIERSLEEVADGVGDMTAFFCCSDSFAGMLINTFAKRGLRVPDDISVMGFDDNQGIRLIRPALTTIRQDITGKGVTATRELIRMIRGETPQSHQIIMHTELIERDTVRNR